MLEAREVDAFDYRRFFPKPGHIYDSVAFSLLNEGKVDQLHFITFAEGAGSPDFGITLGQRDGWLLSPFSAPFGGFEANRPHGVGKWIEAVEALKKYSLSKNCRLRISLPPSFYFADDFVAHQFLAFATTGFRNVPEYNYHFPSHGRELTGTGRNKLKNALKHPFRFEKTRDIERAYNIIKKNREEQGYPLRMSLRQIEETVKIIKADFFVVSLEGVDIASAQIFHVNKRVVQVIYWGDVREFSRLRPMDFLADAVAKHYAGKELIVDIGPSSSDGIPSPGLCEFKKNVGCLLTPKNVFMFPPDFA